MNLNDAAEFYTTRHSQPKQSGFAGAGVQVPPLTGFGNDAGFRPNDKPMLPGETPPPNTGTPASVG